MKVFSKEVSTLTMCGIFILNFRTLKIFRLTVNRKIIFLKLKTQINSLLSVHWRYKSYSDFYEFRS